MRRTADGSMHGDMFDGLGMVEAITRKAVGLTAKKVLLIGAGGAGSAIAHAVCEAGVAYLTIVDADNSRRDKLVHGLNILRTTLVLGGSVELGGLVSPTG